MATQQTKRKPSELKVVFDTNALYNSTASDLFTTEVVELIKRNAKHRDLKILWFLPEIVMLERKYQMQKRGNELLSSIQKMEKLLGHNLNINESIIESRVQEVIARQMQENSVQLFSLEHKTVDWPRLMMDAAFRRPPFEPGDKEKGFRDALVAETFLQIVSTSPATPKICRVALVTADKLLSRAVESRTSDRSNVRIITSTVELEGLINTLVAEVDEGFIAKIREQAAKYFFTNGENDSLYYRENVGKRIQNQFGDELNGLPEGASRRKNNKWLISAPQFVKKEGQRVVWVSQIIVETTASKENSTYPFLNISPSENVYINPFDSRHTTTQSIPVGRVGLYDDDTHRLGFASSGRYTTSALPRERVIAKGKSVFEVTWSVSVSTNNKLSAPKVDNVVFVGTTW